MLAMTSTSQANEAQLQLAQWDFLTDPNSPAVFDDYARFILAHPDWPKMSQLRKAAEERSTPESTLTKAYFSVNPPETTNGLINYLTTLQDDHGRALQRQIIRTTWKEKLRTLDDQHLFLETLSNTISQQEIFERASQLIWEDNLALAKDLFSYLTPHQLALLSARSALRQNTQTAESTLQNVPVSFMTEPGLVLDRVRWLNRNNRKQEAANLLYNYANVSSGVAKDWWRQREDLARWAIENNQAELGYALAAQHGFSSNDNSTQYNDAEWLAGWIALRFLNDPSRALSHFTNMRLTANAVISKARYLYWMGRTLQALGRQEEAMKFYQAGAGYGTSFYGQLAAIERYVTVNISVPYIAAPSLQDQKYFANLPLVQAVVEADRENDEKKVKLFFNAMLETVQTQTQAALATQLAEKLHRRDLAVWASKISGRLGFVVGREGYPKLTGSIPQQPDLPIIHAFVRQESSFDTEAQSPAGALGLMQLMPETAQRTAKKMGIKITSAQLISNPLTNVKIGSYLLSDLLDKNENSLVYAAIGYNAGPARINQWIDRFGDLYSSSPLIINRLKGYRANEPFHWVSIDILESYPFNETRFYVQQILANAEVYHAVLSPRGSARLELQNVLVGQRGKKCIKEKALCE